ncbi:VOC family protein [Rossellomorea aquimaris]|uniref:Catechol 2,3-dioxygenase n=1 Tax=Rossellomorea aquimaris TaxID=189382 RepID=A0A366ESX8_9BACI|nr:VOC family protein [Rossellomorea aquimaris]RBP05512.1 catechol 2,3-dioxygenase [Rossellomorea aquimaris]
MNFHKEPHTFVGEVNIKVENLERSLSFYQEVIGFKVMEQTENRATLTADGIHPLLSLEQPENVLPKQPGTTGLYHFALLLPNRADLGKIVEHFIKLNIQLGSSDHLVSEALYLSDPDGNGIEIYRDRPSSEWTWNGDQVKMAVDPIDAKGILAEAMGQPWEGLPAGTVMGHIHLHVSDLKSTEEFYGKGLGFDVVSRFGSQALFISTGGYHHHIGLNTWNGVGAPRPAENSVGLNSFTLHFPTEEKRTTIIRQLQSIGATIREQNGKILTDDPSGNRIYLSL